MRSWKLYLLLTITAGCAAQVRASRMSEIRTAAATFLQCDEAQVEVTERKAGWVGTGCKKEALCDTKAGTWVCEPSRSFADRATSSLALETGCAADTIRHGPGTVDGQETVFKLVACEKAYVCRVSEDRSQCQLALDPTALELPPEPAPTATRASGATPSLSACPPQAGETARARAVRCRASTPKP